MLVAGQQKIAATAFQNIELSPGESHPR